MLAGVHSLVYNCGLLLLTHPLRKVFRTVDRYPQEHVGMLGSAVLRALTHKGPGALRIHPHPIWMIRNEVRLASHLRHPEAVVSIRRKQLQERRRRVGGVAYWDV